VRELAYDIGKERRGFYLLVEYLSTSAAVAELERNLKLSDVVLRFVSVRQDKNTPPASALPREDDAPEEPGIDDDDDEGLGADAEVGDAE
jgi:small subunit ribosomal protein S6